MGKGWSLISILAYQDDSREWNLFNLNIPFSLVFLLSYVPYHTQPLPSPLVAVNSFTRSLLSLFLQRRQNKKNLLYTNTEYLKEHSYLGKGFGSLHLPFCKAPLSQGPPPGLRSNLSFFLFPFCCHPRSGSKSSSLLPTHLYLQ